jgi:phosphoribosylanthranilate isomerase
MGAGYGGTGKKFNWNMLKDATIGKPFFLSGGIEPGDEESLKEFAALPIGKALFSVDINSKFELSPGIKDMAKVKDFVSKLNSRY